MKVLMVEPGKSPYETEIEGGLESLQAAVGGDIQATYPFDDLVGLICNDEGKLIGLPTGQMPGGENGLRQKNRRGYNAGGSSESGLSGTFGRRRA